jgi:hypothetical protein
MDYEDAIDRENTYSCPICELSCAFLKTHKNLWSHILDRHYDVISEKTSQTCCESNAIFKMSIQYHEKNGKVSGRSCDCPFCFDIENFHHCCDRSSFLITRMYFDRILITL